MNNHISLATIVPQNEPVLDADWIPADDDVMDLIRDHMALMEENRQRRELVSAFEHAKHRQDAYDYMSRVADRAIVRTKKMVLGSLAFFGLAVTMALLVG